MTKKNKFFNYTINRKLYVNVIWCAIFVIGALIVPSLLSFVLKFIIPNKYICSLLSNIIFISIMFLVYYKDIIKEFKLFTINFKNIIKPNIKYYLIGLLLMIGFNSLIVGFVKDISLNESQVRELLFNHKLYMLFNITLIAPLMEELVYRKSVFTVIKNKWLYAIISGLLFGGAHIMINVISDVFVISDLLYILPYGSFGFMFAVMNYESDTTFSSIMMHSIHNLLNGLLLINLHMLGVL